MIYLYTGTPGSGKSYHATNVIDRALRRGINIISNYNVFLNKKHKAEFTFIDIYEMSVNFFVEYARLKHKPRKESQTIIVIDEASIIFNSRDGLNKNRAEWIKFFATHRHLGFDVILITQMDRSLDRQIRGLIEKEFKHRNLLCYGWKGLMMLLIFRKRFVAVEYWYPLGEKTGSTFFSIKKKVMNMYDSFGSFDKDLSEKNTGFVAEYKRKRGLTDEKTNT